MARGKLWAKRGEPEAEPLDAERESGGDPDGFIGPSPNPKTNLLLADLALRGGGMLVRQAIERGLLGRRYAPDKARKILKGRTIAESAVGAAITKLATRSVPGAILVGGGLLAKTLYDRRKGKRAEAEGEQTLTQMAEDGDSQEA